ncbi:J domain-containing protein [Agromyces protaetiae]|nr:J domain-containing protein [Agromyces protaetiae]
MSPTHYEVLGVSPSAPLAEIKLAFRRKARELHPDTGGAKELIDPVLRAWEVLSDPAQRAGYDEELRAEEFRKGERSSDHGGSRRQAPNEDRLRESWYQAQAQAAWFQAQAQAAWFQAQAQAQAEAGWHRAAAEQRARERQEEFERRRQQPYWEALSRLGPRYQRYHTDWRVPLKVVFRWRTWDRFRVATITVSPITVAAILLRRSILESGSALGPYLSTFGFDLVWRGTLYTLAVVFVTLILKLIVWSYRRFVERRTAISEHELIEEYLVRR